MKCSKCGSGNYVQLLLYCEDGTEYYQCNDCGHRFSNREEMTEDQQKIFDEIKRNFEEFVKETCGTEFVEGVKKMPPEVKGCIEKWLSGKAKESLNDYGIEIVDVGNGAVNIKISVPEYVLKGLTE